MKKILIHLLKPLSFLPAILMMYLIYSFSAQTGEVSGALSYEVSYQIVETKNEVLNENKTETELAYSASSIEFYVRKAAHMTEYCILAIAISFPFYVRVVCIDSSGAAIGILLVQAFCWSTTHNPSSKKRR